MRARRRFGRPARDDLSLAKDLSLSPLCVCRIEMISVRYDISLCVIGDTGPGPRSVSRKRWSYFLKGPKRPLRLCPHCTSTSRNVTSLMTARFGTKRRTKGIVTNHGMPVRWSTAHYRFSRAPCTATLYRPPSLTRSFASFPLSLSPSTSLPSTTDFPVSLLSLYLALSHSVSRPPAPAFLLFLFSTIIPSLRS